jgi:plastocyanin
MKKNHSNRQYTLRLSLICILATSMIYILAATGCSKSSSSLNNGGAGGSGGTNPDPNTIIISGTTFSPSTLTVKAGTVVTWKNNDAMVHTATADNGASFNTGNIAAGATASYTTSTTGTFPYHCIFHSGMNGTLVVTP